MTRCCKSYLQLLFLLSEIFALFVIDLTTARTPLNRAKPVNQFHGPLTRNNILDSAEKLFEGKIVGPEAIAIRDGKLYTGLKDGRIIEIAGNNVSTIVKIGKNDCDSDKSCGEPLGMRFDSNGWLFIADAVKGLYKVDVKSGAVTSLVLNSNLVDGRKIVYADDVIITKTGHVYFTEFSVQFHPWLLFYKHQAEGRILHYDPKTKTVNTIFDKLYMPNGIELSPDEDFFIFAQFLQSNILKYYLKGPKKGQVEIFTDNLPGTPDNIRASPRGTYWVALPCVKVPDDPSLWDRIKCRYCRYVVFSSLELALKVIDLSRKYVQIDALNVIHDSGLVIEVNGNGEIVRSLHSPKGVIHTVTHAIEHENTLYLGTNWNSYIGKLKLN